MLGKHKKINFKSVKFSKLVILNPSNLLDQECSEGNDDGHLWRYIHVDKLSVRMFLWPQNNPIASYEMYIATLSRYR